MEDKTTKDNKTKTENKQNTNHVKKLESSMLGITLRARIPKQSIRNITGVKNALETNLHLKWNCSGHVARMTDGRWTEMGWTPRHEACKIDDDPLVGGTMT